MEFEISFTQTENIPAEETQTNLNWTEIEEMLRSPNGLKVTKYAQSIKMKPADLRQQVIDRFGSDRVEFRRGRSGGAFIVC